jgi:hypothetical protein
VARGTFYNLNFAREQKSLATPGIYQYYVFCEEKKRKKTSAEEGT